MVSVSVTPMVKVYSIRSWVVNLYLTKFHSLFYGKSMRFLSVKGIEGEYTPPADKSITHRAIMLASVSDGVCEVVNPLYTGDCLSTLGCVEALGVSIEEVETVNLRSLKISGVGLHGFAEPMGVLNAGNSGTTIRLLSGLLAGLPIYSVVTGDSSLLRRPMDRVTGPLRAMGAKIEGRARGRFAPLSFLPGEGLLEPIEYELPVASAQVKSSILFAALRSRGTVVLRGLIASRDHTERMFNYLNLPIEIDDKKIVLHPVSGIPPFYIRIPGDISSASFFIVAALLGNRELLVRSCGLNPTRLGLVEILRDMGANIDISIERDEMGEPIGELVVRKSSLHGISIGADKIPSLIDEIPLVVIVALFADGRTVITGAEELRHKESDRIETTAGLVRALGGDLEVLPDGFIIDGPQRLHRGKIDSRGDHRIAMAGAILGSVIPGGVEVEGFNVSLVSYPGFVDDFKALGGVVEA